MTDRTQSPDDQLYAGAFAPLDASRDDPFAVAFGIRGAVLSDPSQFDSVPGTERSGHAYMEPMNWRLSDVQRNTLDLAAEDRRLEVQIVVDPTPEQGGDALFGQPELYSARNRSTRYVDPTGRVGLSGSGKRLVDSYDQRYALSEQIHTLEMVPTPPDFQYLGFPEAPELVIVDGGFVSGSTGILPDLGLPPTGYVYSYGALPPSEFPGRAEPGVTRVRGAGGRLSPHVSGERFNRADVEATRGPEMGSLWSTVFAPEAARGFYRRGLEETRTGPLPIRTDALFAMGPVDPELGALLIGSVAFTSGDADRIGARGEAQLFRGEMWHSRQRALYGGHLTVLEGEAETGEWVPVVAVDAEIPTSDPFERDKPPPVPPPPPKKERKRGRRNPRRKPKVDPDRGESEGQGPLEGIKEEDLSPPLPPVGDPVGAAAELIQAGVDQVRQALGFGPDDDGFVLTDAGTAIPTAPGVLVGEEAQRFVDANLDPATLAEIQRSVGIDPLEGVLGPGFDPRPEIEKSWDRLKDLPDDALNGQPQEGRRGDGRDAGKGQVPDEGIGPLGEPAQGGGRLTPGPQSCAGRERPDEFGHPKVQRGVRVRRGEPELEGALDEFDPVVVVRGLGDEPMVLDAIPGELPAGNAGNSPVQVFGEPGGPRTLDGSLKLAQVQLSALQDMFVAGFSGHEHGALEAALSLQSSNLVLNDGHYLGQRTMGVGGEIASQRAALTVHALRDDAGGRGCHVAGSSVLHLVREWVGSNVQDCDPILLLEDDRGDAWERTEGDLISTVERDFVVTGDREVWACGIDLKDATGLAGSGLQDDGTGRLEVVSGVGTGDHVVSDSGTTNVVTTVTERHETTGTPAAGFGLRHDYDLHDSANTDVLAAYAEVKWSDAAGPNYDVDFSLNTRHDGGIYAFLNHVGSSGNVVIRSQGSTAFNFDASQSLNISFLDLAPNGAKNLGTSGRPWNNGFIDGYWEMGPTAAPGAPAGANDGRLYNTSGNLFWHPQGGSAVQLDAAAGAGDVTAAANLTANAIVIGDDGVKGVKTGPGATISDEGAVELLHTDTTGPSAVAALQVGYTDNLSGVHPVLDLRRRSSGANPGAGASIDVLLEDSAFTPTLALQVEVLRRDDTVGAEEDEILLYGSSGGAANKVFLKFDGETGAPEAVRLGANFGITALRGDTIEPQADFIPDANNAYDLGSSSFKFKDGYFAGKLTVDGAIDPTWIDFEEQGSAPTNPAANHSIAYFDTAGDLHLLDSVGTNRTVATTGLAIPTGVIYDYVGTTAPSGWLLLEGGTIGNAASGASVRANADTESLFTLLWNSMTNTEAPVSGGRGASAAADFAANKTITIPDGRGRSIMGSGTGSGLTARTHGAQFGTETHPLTVGEMPSHSHTYSGSSSTTLGNTRAQLTAAGETATPSTNAQGSGTAHNNVQPNLALRRIIKL